MPNITPQLVLFAYALILAFLHREFIVAESDENFSGVYTPDLLGSGQAEDFAAAWLISKWRFLASEGSIHASSNMAGVSFAVVRNKYHKECKEKCHTIMSRDYLDFLVEHLSSTSNQVPNSNEHIFRIFNTRMRLNAKNLKAVALVPQSRAFHDNRLNQTVALLVYSSITFSKPQEVGQSKIRRSFFEATFWGIYRYVPNVVVFVASDKDRMCIERMQLPHWQLIHMHDVPVDVKNRTISLPRYSLDWAIHNFKENQLGWENFNYVFFSEGDQILHWRHFKGVYDALDNSDGRFAMVPHRMQTLPLAKTIKRPDLQNKFYNHPASQHLNLPNVSIVQLDLYESAGSCCDSGRLNVAPCGRWWYQCPDWGLKSMDPWMRFGTNGFTTPTATIHKGYCTYSEERKLCPIPEECQDRIPSREPDGTPATGMDLCDEIKIVRKIGPVDELAAAAAKEKAEK